MVKILKILAIIIFFNFSLVQSQDYKKIKITIDNTIDLDKLTKSNVVFDHFKLENSNTTTVFVTENEYDALIKSGLQIEIIIDNWYEYYKNSSIKNSYSISELQKSSNVKNFNFGSMGGYFTLQEVYNELDKMKAEYPQLISQKTIIGRSYENRNIYSVKISDNPEVLENEAKVLFTSLHHAREPGSMMQLVYFMKYLLQNYFTNKEVKYLIDNREIIFILVVNPDGYFFNEMKNPNGGGMWRKNRRLNEDGSFGVDLNRNYGPYEYWNSSNNGSSTIPSSDTYRGTAPFSEPETEVIKNFLINKNISNCLNYHSYGNLLIYPYGAINKETEDSLFFRKYATEMTKDNNYSHGTDWQLLYSTRGNSDDYMYDGDTTNIGKILTMTPEIGTNFDGFWPNLSRIIPIAEENLQPNIYYTWVAGEKIEFEKYNFDKDFYTNGDKIKIDFTIENVGLKSSENLYLKLTSNNKVSIKDTIVNIGKLKSGERRIIFNPFEISYINKSELNSDSINFSISNDQFEYYHQNIAIPTVIKNIEISKGWNLLSYPFAKNDMSANNLFPIISGEVYGFNDKYFITDSLKNGFGYWVKFSDNSLLDISGSSVINNSITLSNGWNIIGPYDTIVTINKISTIPNGIIQSNFFGFNTSYYLADTLKPGKGYWVKVSQDGELNYGNTTRTLVKMINIVEIGKDWNSISVLDKENSLTTLYTTNESIDLSSFDLPPVPPSGIKDVRFGSSRMVENLNNNESIKLQSLTYPVVITINGTDVRIKDKVGGNLLNKIVKDGEKVVISNPSINEIELESIEIPVSYQLSQNYPNPFNPSTKIKYGLPEKTNVRLEIYNVLGEKVTTLINQEMEKGYHEIEFNGSKLSSGVYIYRIYTHKFTDSKKFILLK